MTKRAGTYKKNLKGDLSYRSFMPSMLPPDPPLVLDGEAINLLVKANKEIRKLESIASMVPDANLFISMYVRKEALLSSQIEGTQATLEDIFDPKVDINTNQDVADVINYIRATEYATERLKELPICSRLLREIHSVMMAGVRGQKKNPGEFRNSQNWIGPQGSTIKNASYIPPNPEDMNMAMSDLDKYINAEDDLDPLIRASLIHYQFETIHPFLDGNGRVGRLLVILFLMEKRLITRPLLYISYYLKRNRIEYYDRLSEVRKRGDYEQWVKFFLRALASSAEDAVITINRLIDLHRKNVEIIKSMKGASKNTLLVFEYLEKNPIIDISKTAKVLGISFNTVSSAVDRLLDSNILIKETSDKRNRTFIYKDYLNILSSD